jgi:hypothetical protein
MVRCIPKFIRILIVTVLVGRTGLVFAQNFARTHQLPPPIQIALPVSGLSIGEQFFYTVRWMGIPVGHASLTVEAETEEEGHPVIQVVAQARSNKFLSKFYPLEDTVHTYIDRKGGFSRRYLKHQREGRYRSDEEMTFYPDQGRARYHSFLNGSTKWMDIPGEIHDPLSSFYAFRQMPVEVGQTVTMDVNSDEDNWSVEIDVTKTKYLELKGIGAFDCFEVEPRARFKGLLVERGRVWVYFTADARRVPVLFKIQTPWGVITGTILKKGSFG